MAGCLAVECVFNLLSGVVRWQVDGVVTAVIMMGIIAERVLLVLMRARRGTHNIIEALSMVGRNLPVVTAGTHNIVVPSVPNFQLTGRIGIGQKRVSAGHSEIR
jgi:hypothetical protein